jgi:ribonuclease HI
LVVVVANVIIVEVEKIEGQDERDRDRRVDQDQDQEEGVSLYISTNYFRDFFLFTISFSSTMSANKVYAVWKKSGGADIFSNWNDCFRATHGVSGVIHKSFPSMAAASTWLSQQAERAGRRDVVITPGYSAPPADRDGEEDQEVGGIDDGKSTANMTRSPNDPSLWIIRKPNGFTLSKALLEVDSANTLSVFTDGSHCGSHHGWAFYIPKWNAGVASKHSAWCADGVSPWSNNKSELLAIHEAIKFITTAAKDNKPEYKGIVIYSDSTYAVNSLTTWYKNWFTRDMKPKDTNKKNLDIIGDLKRADKAFLEEYKIPIVYTHTRAHGRIDNGLAYFNDIVDRMARHASLSYQRVEVQSE